MTGSQNSQISHDEFGELAKKYLVLIEHPQSVFDMSVSSDLACREHGVIVSWMRTAKEQLEGTYEFSSVELYHAIKEHIEEFHHG